MSKHFLLKTATGEDKTYKIKRKLKNKTFLNLDSFKLFYHVTRGHIESGSKWLNFSNGVNKMDNI